MHQQHQHLLVGGGAEHPAGDRRLPIDGEAVPGGRRQPLVQPGFRPRARRHGFDLQRHRDRTLVEDQLVGPTAALGEDRT
jgi:hypothetical protein